ncbi:hypothetical protein BBF93_06585 [Hyphomonas sp. CACIAM 19H1]|nr:hypothetical protein BBF93_06585 [Hyphomonas sp. CACIAM 19H1]
MNVKTFSIISAILPRNNMRRSQERRIADAAQWALPAPVLKETFAKHLLSDTLNEKTLRFSLSRKLAYFFLKGEKGRVRKAGSQPV